MSVLPAVCVSCCWWVFRLPRRMIRVQEHTRLQTNQTPQVPYANLSPQFQVQSKHRRSTDPGDVCTTWTTSMLNTPEPRRPAASKYLCILQGQASRIRSVSANHRSRLQIRNAESNNSSTSSVFPSPFNDLCYHSRQTCYDTPSPVMNPVTLHVSPS